MSEYKFKVGKSLIIIVRASNITAAWYNLALHNKDILTDYGYVEYIGVRDGRK